MAGAAAADRSLDDVEQQLRSHPEQAIQALAPLITGSRGARQVEAMVIRGEMQARLFDADEVEKTARTLEHLGAFEGDVLATAAAGFLRARNLFQRDAALAQADNLLSAALLQLPVSAPATLRLRFLELQGEIRSVQDKINDAVALHQQAVTLADQIGIAWKRSHARYKLAGTLNRAQQNERALAVDDEAVTLARQADDTFALGNAMLTRALVLSDLGRNDESLEAYQRAIELFRRCDAKRERVLGMADLADHYLLVGDHAMALSVAQAALPLARELHDSYVESVALANSGLAQIALGQSAKGIALVNAAMRIEQRAGAYAFMADIQRDLGMALEKAGELRGAWNALTQYRSLVDDVLRREHQQAVLELQESFDAERRKQAMVALRTDNGLKEAKLQQRSLEQILWTLGLVVCTLTGGAVVMLGWRTYRSNQLLTLSNAQLQQASVRDALTGLANRRHLLATIAEHTRLDGGLRASLLLVDIDHFKEINDRHGHLAGDEVLVDVARRLSAAMGPHDLAVRWGGEEFLLVVGDLAPEAVEQLAHRLLTAIGEQPVLADQGPIPISASIGFATFPLPDSPRAMNWERSVDLVDTAMYLAKAHGRNQAFGVRWLARGVGPVASAQAGVLETAWRSGAAELARLAGPIRLQGAS